MPYTSSTIPTEINFSTHNRRNGKISKGFGTIFVMTIILLQLLKSSLQVRMSSVQAFGVLQQYPTSSLRRIVTLNDRMEIKLVRTSRNIYSINDYRRNVRCYNTDNDDDTFSCITHHDDLFDDSSTSSSTTSASSSSSTSTTNKSTIIKPLTVSTIEGNTSNTYNNVDEVKHSIQAQYNDPLATTLNQLRMTNVVRTVQKFLDTISDGWVLSYANLYPDTPTTIAGQIFLLTNVFYVMIGYIFVQQFNNLYFGLLCEFVAMLSYNYHYQQLANIDRNAVRLSLLCDYIGSFTIILIGLYYVILEPLLLYVLSEQSTSVDLQILQFECVICSIVSILFLLSSWIYEAGKPYMTLHGMWHISSAYTGYLIGTYHYLFILQTTVTTST
jgi:hypothetical protein